MALCLAAFTQPAFPRFTPHCGPYPVTLLYDQVTSDLWSPALLPWTFGSSHLLEAVGRAAVWEHSCAVSVGTDIFISLGFTPGSGIAGSRDNSVCGIF